MSKSFTNEEYYFLLKHIEFEMSRTRQFELGSRFQYDAFLKLQSFMRNIGRTKDLLNEAREELNLAISKLDNPKIEFNQDLEEIINEQKD